MRTPALQNPLCLGLWHGWSLPGTCPAGYWSLDPGAAQTKRLYPTAATEEGEEGTSQPCWGLTSEVPPPPRHG